MWMFGGGGEAAAEAGEVDKASAELIARVRDNSDPACPDMSPDVFDAVYGELLDFTLARSDQQAKVELKPGGGGEALTYANRHEWARLAEGYLCHECDAQVAAIRKGLSMLVPLEALAFFTPLELEKLVIGEKDWSVAELKRTAEVRQPPP